MLPASVRPILQRVLIALIGLLPGFFLAFNLVFSDASDWLELLFGILVMAGIYLFLGVISGLITESWRSGLWLAGGAVILVALYSLREQHRLLLHASVIIAAVGPACLGAYVGDRMRKKRTQPLE